MPYHLYNPCEPCCGCCSALEVQVAKCSAQFGMLEDAEVVVRRNEEEIATCTTDEFGICVVQLPDKGDYEVRVTVPEAPVEVVQKAIVCGVNRVSVGVYRFLQFLVGGCNGVPLPGATITATRNGGSGQQYTSGTDATGRCEVILGESGVYSWTIDANNPRLASVSGTADVSLICTPPLIAVNLQPAPGYTLDDDYVCMIDSCPFPVSFTLNLSDSAYGDCVLNYIPSLAGWFGGMNIDYEGCVGCPPYAGSPLNFYYHGAGTLGTFGGKTLMYTYGQVSNPNLPYLCPGGGSTPIDKRTGLIEVESSCYPFVRVFQPNNSLLWCLPSTITITE